MKNIDLSVILIILTIAGASLGLLKMFILLIKSKKPNIKLSTDFFEQLDKKFDLGLVLR